jgi:hypothetical protein
MKTMKKSTLGLIISAFGLFGIIGGAQDPAMKNQPAFFIICAVFLVAGFLLFFIGRKQASKTPAAKRSGSTEGVATKVKSTPAEPSYEVDAGRADSYVIPSPCCACAGPADKKISVSCRESIGNRTLSLTFPICRVCHQERYRRWTSIAPVSMSRNFFSAPGIRIDNMAFKFSNREYAEEFARLNKAKFLNPDRFSQGPKKTS